MKYLLNNRKHATYWNSTRDTALVVEAFADYLKASGEAKPNLSLEVSIDGKRRKTVEITAENLFTFDNKLVLEGDRARRRRAHRRAPQDGRGPDLLQRLPHQLHARRPHQGRRPGAEGRAPLLQADARREDGRPSPAAAARPSSSASRSTTARRSKTSASSTSGDLVEVELVVDSKNDYEYIVLEDMKAAGFEPVEVRSGYNGNELGAYVEYRDERVALFCRTLARGQHSVSYRLRAEIPGQFSALPTKASAMYAPELRANSDELKVQIVD